MKMSWNWLRAGMLAAIGMLAIADESDYRLWAESALRDRLWVVVPHLAAPPGRTVSYQIVSSKHGRSGKSETRQSGVVTIGPEGSAVLAGLRLGVAPEEQAEVVVKVFDGLREVADLVLQPVP